MSKLNRNGRKRALMAAAAGTIASALACGSASRAATLTWTAGAADGNFNTAGNWDTNTAPAAADDIIFASPTVPAASLTSALGAATTIQSLTFNAGLAGPVTINTTNTNRLTVNGRTGDDIVVLGGSHVIGETDANSSPNVGFKHGANFNFNIATGASLEIAARINQSNSGNAVSKSGGGTLVLSAANSGTGGWNINNSVFTVNGGTLLLKNNGATGNSGNKFTINSGAVLELQSNYGSNNGTLTLNDGSTLRSDTGSHSITNGTGAVALAGSSTIDVPDSTLTIANHFTGAGNFTKTGTGTLSLTQTDNSWTGNMTIAGGTVTVGSATSIATAKGITLLSGTTLGMTSTGLSLASGQTLTHSGTVNGNVTVNANTALVPGGTGAAGTATFANDLTLTGGRVSIDLAATPAGTSDFLSIAGALNLSGPAQLAINRLNGSLAAGTYTLATFAGAFSGNVSNLTLPTVRQTLTLVDPNSNAGKLDLIVGAGSSASLTWAGDGSANVWKTNDSVNNFLNGASPDKFFDWDDVTFTDAGSNAPNINVQGLVQPNSITINNSNTHNYTFGGTGTMVAVNQLTKSGNGIATISNADGNAITNVDVNGGKLVFTNSNAINTLNANNGGSVTLANTSADGGNIAVANVNNGGTFVFGNGTTANAVNTLTVNSGGTLTFANTVAPTIGAFNILSGSIVNIGDGVTAGVGNAGASISNNQGTVVYNRPDDWTSAPLIAGSGTVQKKGAGIVTPNSSSTYTGATQIIQGTLKVTGNTSMGSLSGGAVTITDGGSLDVGGNTVANGLNFGQKQFFISGNGLGNGIGALTNSNSAVSQFNAFQLVTLTNDAVVGGPGRLDVRSPSSTPTAATLDLGGFTLTKTGTGELGLVRAAVTPGNIHVTAGTLDVEAATSITGAGTLTFDAGSTGQWNVLTGTVNRNIVLNGGTLSDTANSAGTTIASNINLLATSGFNVNSTSGVSYTGVISGTGGLTKNSAGPLTFTANNTYSGPTTINGGTLSVASSSNLGDASPTNGIVFGGGTLQATGDITSAGRSVTLNGDGTIDTGSSNVTLGAVDGTGTFTKNGGGNLTVKHVVSGNLTVNSGTLIMTPDSSAAGTSHVGALALPGSKLDLGANKLITTSPVGTVTGGTYSDVTGLVQSGRGTGMWNGASGIVTTQTGATSSILNSIGVATAQQVKNLANPTDTVVFSGQTVTGSDTLVMYTYGGDANLDGKIDISDYGRIDFNVPLGVSGWYNGDFNYDGKIDISDYGIIDFNIGIQGAQLPTGDSTIAATAPGARLDGVTAVPEPTTFSLLALGAAATLTARRRRRVR